MPERGFEELATEVVKEIGASIRGFRIDTIDSSEREGMTIRCSWTAPYRLSLAVQLRGNESDDDIKAEIRRQLEPLLEGLSETQSKGKPVRVLLVEDDALFVKIISAALASFDVNVEAVLSAESAVKRLQERSSMPWSLISIWNKCPESIWWSTSWQKT